MAMPHGILRRAGEEAPLSTQIELADSFASRFMGLMGRSSAVSGAGLWLAGTNSIHMFFMRFSIDAVFLGPRAEDGSRTILAIRPGLRPWTGIVWLIRGAKACLELPAGASSSLAVGERLVYELDR